jgi:excisionase family DNA binding protein
MNGTPVDAGRSSGRRRIVDKGLLTIMEAADYLSCGRTKLFELLGTGDLRVVKLGRATRIPRHELDRWIATQTEAFGNGPDRVQSPSEAGRSSR